MDFHYNFPQQVFQLWCGTPRPSAAPNPHPSIDLLEQMEHSFHTRTSGIQLWCGTPRPSAAPNPHTSIDLWSYVEHFLHSLCCISFFLYRSFLRKCSIVELERCQHCSQSAIFTWRKVHIRTIFIFGACAIYIYRFSYIHVHTRIVIIAHIHELHIQ